MPYLGHISSSHTPAPRPVASHADPAHPGPIRPAAAKNNVLPTDRNGFHSPHAAVPPHVAARQEKLVQAARTKVLTLQAQQASSSKLNTATERLQELTKRYPEAARKVHGNELTDMKMRQTYHQGDAVGSDLAKHYARLDRDKELRSHARFAAIKKVFFGSSVDRAEAKLRKAELQAGLEQSPLTRPEKKPYAPSGTGAGNRKELGYLQNDPDDYGHEPTPAPRPDPTPHVRTRGNAGNHKEDIYRQYD